MNPKEFPDFIPDNEAPNYFGAAPDFIPDASSTQFFKKTPPRTVGGVIDELQGEEEAPSVGGVGGFALGIGKGFLDGARGLGNLALGGIQRGAAVIDSSLSSERTYGESLAAVKQAHSDLLTTDIPGLKQLGKGLKSLDYTTPEAADVNDKLEGKNFAQDAGKVTEFVAELVIPTTFAKRLATQVGKTIIQKNPRFAAMLMGNSEDVVKSALKSPEIADQALTKGDEMLRAAVTKGAETSKKLKTTMSTAYRGMVKTIYDQVPDLKVIDPPGLLKAFENTARQYGVEFFGNGLERVPSFARSKIQASGQEMSNIKQVYEMIKSWPASRSTLQGADVLHDTVGTLMKYDTVTGAKSATLGNFYGVMRNVITRNLGTKSDDLAKSYRKANEFFSTNVEMYDDLTSLFNSGDPFKKVANYFSKNNDSLRGLIGFYEKMSGKKMVPIIAGRELGQPLSRSSILHNLMNPAYWFEVFFDPVKQGRALLRKAPGQSKQIIENAAGLVTSKVNSLRRIYDTFSDD